MLDEDARHVDAVGFDLSDTDDRLSFAERHVTGHGGRHVEVARREPERQIAQPVGLVRLDEREVGRERCLEHARPCAEHADVLGWEPGNHVPSPS